MRAAFNLLRKDVLSLLSSFPSIMLVLLLDDCSRGEYILVLGFVFLHSEYLCSREPVG